MTLFSSPVCPRNSVFKMIHFPKTPLLKLFLKVSIFISVFGHFSVDDRQKCIKEYAFSNANASVWRGLN